MIVRKNSGFTLVELMVTVAIVSILSSIAYPSYTEFMRKGKRAEARGVLLDSSQWMERFFTENQRYHANLANTATTDATVFYSAFKYSPKSTSASSTANYEITLTVNSATPNSYTLTSAPINSMLGDKCGNYIVNHTGARGNTGYASSYTNATEAAKDCWK